MNIGIVGLGLIGTSLALAFKDKGFSLWGIDVNKVVVEELLKKKIINIGDTEISKLESYIKNTEIIFISVYPSSVIKVIEELKEFLNEDQIITDTASVKENIMNYVEKDAFLKKIFIGGHPLAGKEKLGFENSDPKLFEDKIYFITPASCVDKDKIEKLKRIITLISAKPYTISPKDHDKILSYTSHLPQIISYILSFTVLSKDNFKNFVGTGFKDTTRLSKSPPILWIDIIKENKDNILKSLLDFKEVLDEVYKNINKEEWDELRKFFENIREKRFEVEK